jgi:hypothetical protein
VTRAPNPHARDAILALRARGLSLREIAARTPYTLAQVRYYASRNALPHTPREVIRSRARPRTRAREGRTRSAFPNAPLTTRRPRTTRAAPRRARTPRSTVRRIANVHDARFTMRFLTPPGRYAHFAWDREWLARGVAFRSHTFRDRKGLSVQMSGMDSLTAKVSVRPDRSLPLREQAAEMDRRALARARWVREEMSRRLGCEVSEPVAVGTKKHSLTGLTAGKLLRDAGVTLAPDGPEGLGNDDTPEPGTIEARDAGDAAPTIRGDAFLFDVRERGRELGRIDERIAAVATRVAELGREVRSDHDLLMAMSSGDLARSEMLRELLVRVTAGERGRAPGAGATSEWGAGRAA